VRGRIRAKFLLFCSASSLLFGCVSSDTAFYERGINLDEFFGEKITLKENHSTQINNLNLRIYLPDQYKLLFKANPKVELFTKEELVQSLGIVNAVSTFELNETIVADFLFLKLSLFYCKEGKQGLCISKKVLFEVPLVRNCPPQIWI